MELPDELRAVLEAVRKIGRPRLVGGCVRDWLLGFVSKDYDVEVAGVDFETLHRALSPFGATDVVGKNFGVIKVRLAGKEYDFSLPRRESKIGSGHRGFAIAPDPNLSDAEAAARRDFTINAMAYDPFENVVIDPWRGQADLKARILRHTSPAFIEDPLRVLRAFQFSARLNFTLASETVAIARSISETFAELPVERVWGEWEKWATQSIRPSRGLAVLEETNWLRHFPEVAAMRGTLQEPEWHPEGDVFVHTQHCLDALVGLDAWQQSPPSRRALLTFAVLAHDFGKPPTTQQLERRGKLRWTSHGHEMAGGPLTERFLRRIGAPLGYDAPARALVIDHLAHHHGAQGEFSDSQVRRLARKLSPATIDDLALVMMADSLGRPPLRSPETMALIEKLIARAHALEIENSAPRPIILGRHLLALGLKAGPSFRKILDEAFEAQLDGVFADDVAGMEWLRIYLRHHPMVESPDLRV